MHLPDTSITAKHYPHIKFDKFSHTDLSSILPPKCLICPKHIYFSKMWLIKSHPQNPLNLASGPFISQKSCRHERILHKRLIGTIPPMIHLFKVVCAHKIDTWDWGLLCKWFVSFYGFTYYIIFVKIALPFSSSKELNSNHVWKLLLKQPDYKHFLEAFWATGDM